MSKYDLSLHFHNSPAGEVKRPAEALMIDGNIEAPARGAVQTVENSIVNLARHVHKTRMRANSIFGSRILCDPKFEMLLVLYVAAADQRRVSVSDLCNSTSVPQTTGLRHIDALEARGFLKRFPDALDGRRWWVEASPHALQSMQVLMAEFQQAH